MASSMLVFDEIAKHNKRDDCWLIISGKVYDVTPFMDDHPGGDEILLSATGKDATTDFEDVGHKDSIRQLMEKYVVGEIDLSTVPAKPDKKRVLIKVLQVLVPIFILGLALAGRILTKNGVRVSYADYLSLVLKK